MLFPHAFWRKADMFGRIAPSRDRRGEFFLFYSYATISGGAVLAALVAGDAAVEFEKIDPNESARRVLATLTGIFNPKGIRVPTPLQVSSPFWIIPCPVCRTHTGRRHCKVNSMQTAPCSTGALLELFLLLTDGGNPCPSQAGWVLRPVVYDMEICISAPGTGDVYFDAVHATAKAGLSTCSDARTVLSACLLSWFKLAPRAPVPKH